MIVFELISGFRSKVTLELYALIVSQQGENSSWQLIRVYT